MDQGDSSYFGVSACICDDFASNGRSFILVEKGTKVSAASSLGTRTVSLRAAKGEASMWLHGKTNVRNLEGPENETPSYDLACVRV